MSAEPLPSDAATRVGLTTAASTSERATTPYRPGAPNVVVVVLDDIGFAQLGCFDELR